MNDTEHSVPRRVFLALAWRFRRWVGDKRVDDFLVRIARKYRPMLKRPVFIGITGSVGKTTSKELSLAVLSQAGRCVANSASLNALPEVGKNVLRTRFWHDFTIAELSEHKPGIMADNFEVFAPSICVVTTIGDDHVSAFGTREDIAAEVASLVHAIPAEGTAVLNADDPLVNTMGEQANCRVIRYGLNPSAELRASGVTSRWPDRLCFDVHYGSQTVPVRTQLCGTYWIGAALSAIGVGLAAGMSLQEAAASLVKAEPVKGRMQPVATPDDIWFIRDDFKTPHWAFSLGLEFFKEAEADRKIAVIGEISDIRNKKEKRYLEAARMALETFDITIFVGPWATSALGATRTRHDTHRLFAVRHVRDAAQLVKRFTRPGDLVLLKGTLSQDHLERIIWDREAPFACWRDDCGHNWFCDGCSARTQKSGPPAGEPDYDMMLTWEQRGPSAALVDTPDGADQSNTQPKKGRQVAYVVGLGNPGAEYVHTPHNVGYRVVESFADRQGWEWQGTDRVSTAGGLVGDAEITLVKCHVAMNNSGRELVQMSRELPLTPSNTLLVFDDLGLPLGDVRHRANGSAGGHRGVSAIIEAFQSDDFARLKVGTRTESQRKAGSALVTTPFTEEEGARVDEAIEKACNDLLQIV
ncbi:MAG: aminoacyl-tRNA hydrolase [Gammaproteobacteria bacterium]|nr:aminoacyl-tRNA hydrolase [Gammaproteobacteria bacterium]